MPTYRNDRRRGVPQSAFERNRSERLRDARYDAQEIDDEALPTDRRYWRANDYDEADFGRQDDRRVFDRGSEGFLTAENRRRFLRDDDRYMRVDQADPYDWPAGRADERESGPYRGRGPKGYMRSDARIHEDVCDRLTEHPSIDASDIEVSVTEGDVTLTGRVDSRAVKHLSEVMVETVAGVKEVHNQLRVAPLDTEAWAAPSSEYRREARAQKAVTPKTPRR